MHFYLLANKTRVFITSIVAISTVGSWIYFQYGDFGTSKEKESGRILLNPCVYDENHRKDNKIEDRFPKCIYQAPPSILTDAGGGRLGNRMFSYAALFAISQYNHRQAFMSPDLSNFISKYFKVTMNTMNQSLYDKIQWTKREVGGDVDGSIRNLTTPYLALAGGAQSWKYFDEIRPQILQEFRFYDHIVKSTKSLLRDIRHKFLDSQRNLTRPRPRHAKRAIMIGVHVRRGDYKDSARLMGFYLPSAKFYEGAMAYLQNKYGNHPDQKVIFVVASDDNEWCMQNLVALKTFQIHILKGAPEDMPGLDLAILSSCDHVIFGVGTFGFWIGYLNRGEVIYCSTCITPNTGWLRVKAVYNGDYGNFVLPKWTGFSRDGNKTDRSALAKSSLVT